jgi:hypothetical protein
MTDIVIRLRSKYRPEKPGVKNPTELYWDAACEIERLRMIISNARTLAHNLTVAVASEQKLPEGK